MAIKKNIGTIVSMYRYGKIISQIFAVAMFLIGIVDLTRPEVFKLAMDGIHMPHYILWILGFAKILGALIILFSPLNVLVEWAFSGFFVWAVGGISAHCFSGHGLRETWQILALFLILIFAYIGYRSSLTKG